MCLHQVHAYGMWIWRVACGCARVYVHVWVRVNENACACVCGQVCMQVRVCPTCVIVLAVAAAAAAADNNSSSSSSNSNSSSSSSSNSGSSSRFTVCCSSAFTVRVAPLKCMIPTSPLARALSRKMREPRGTLYTLPGQWAYHHLLETHHDVLCSHQLCIVCATIVPGLAFSSIAHVAA